MEPNSRQTDGLYEVNDLCQASEAERCLSMTLQQVACRPTKRGLGHLPIKFIHPMSSVLKMPNPNCAYLQTVGHAPKWPGQSHQVLADGADTCLVLVILK